MKEILFIGGWTRDKRSYKALFDSIPDGYKVLFLPCHDVLDGDSMDDSADHILDYLKTNGIDKTIIAGHSLGGTVAIEFTLRYPKLIEKLILIDSGGLKVNQPFSRKLKNILRDQFLNFSRKIGVNIGFGIRVARRTRQHIQSLKIAYSYDLSDKIRKLNIQTIILWGENDQVYPTEQGQIFNKLIKNSRLVIIPKMDHDWIIHSPKYFWREAEN